jgi:hypothetical protein
MRACVFVWEIADDARTSLDSPPDKRRSERERERPHKMFMRKSSTAVEKKCMQCKEVLRDFSVTTKEGRTYHQSCFSCAKCREPLSGTYVEVPPTPTLGRTSSLSLSLSFSAFSSSASRACGVAAAHTLCVRVRAQPRACSRRARLRSPAGCASRAMPVWASRSALCATRSSSPAGSSR